MKNVFRLTVLMLLALISNPVSAAQDYNSYLTVQSEVLHEGRAYTSSAATLKVAKKQIYVVASNGGRDTRPLRKIRPNGSLGASSRRMSVGSICKPSVIKESSRDDQWRETGGGYAVLCEPVDALVTTYELDSRDGRLSPVRVCSWVFPHKFKVGVPEDLLTLHNYGGWVVVDTSTPPALSFCMRSGDSLQ